MNCKPITLLFVVAIVFATNIARGTDYYWTGASNSTLDNAANWNTAADGTGTAASSLSAGDTCRIDCVSGEISLSGGSSFLPKLAVGTDATIKYSNSKDDATLSGDVEVAAGFTLTFSAAKSHGIVVSNGILGAGNVIVSGTSSAFKLAGTAATFAGTLVMGGKNDGGNTFTLGGGTVELAADAALNGKYKFAGGKMVIRDDVTVTDVSSYVDSSSTGAIDVEIGAGRAQTWASAVTCLNGLTKRGAGNLALTATTAYGDVDVEGGTLTIPAGSTLGKLTLASGSTIVIPADASWEAGEVTLFTLSDTTGTALTTSNVEISGLGGHASWTLDATTGAVKANLAKTVLEWNGADNADWSGANWKAGETIGEFFSANDAVAFTETSLDGEVAKTVTVSTTVAPSAVTVSPNAGHSFTFTGNGTINSATAVAVTGGELVIASDVLPETVIATSNGGALKVAADGGTVNIAGISGALNVVSGTVNINAAPAEGTYITNNAAIVLKANWELGQNASGLLTGAGTMVVDGATFQITGYPAQTSGFTGDVTVRNGGKLYLTRGNSSAGSATDAFGTGKITLSGGTIETAKGSWRPVFNNDIEIADGTQNTITISSKNSNQTLAGDLTGSGELNLSCSGDADRNGELKGDLSGFRGTLNITQTARMVIIDSENPGSADATWNVTGTPSSETLLLKYARNATVPLGDFNVSSAKALVEMTAGGTLKIGNLGNGSTINGVITNGSDSAALVIEKVGSGALTLGSTFKTASAGGKVSILVRSGSLVSDATLSVDVSYESGATETLTLEDPASTADVVLFRTTGTVSGCNNVAVSSNSTLRGKWKLYVDSTSEPGYNILKAKYVPRGVVIIIQ